MDKKSLDFAVEKTREMMGSESCSGEARAAAQAWLDAVGTEGQAAETKKYLDELQADLMPVDSLIGFADSDAGVQLFGAEVAKNVAEHGRQIKAAGAEYCDCPACAAAAAILEKKELLLS